MQFDRIVRLTVLLTFAAPACAGPPQAAAPQAVAPQDSRLRDLVRVSDGRFLYDDLAVCELRLPYQTSPKFQIHSQAEAPSSGLVSRDNFVQIVTGHEIMFGLEMAQVRPGITPTDAVRALHCTPLASPIGTPDIELRLTMTADGIQTEATDTATGKKTRTLRTWEDVSN